CKAMTLHRVPSGLQIWSPTFTSPINLNPFGVRTLLSCRCLYSASLSGNIRPALPPPAAPPNSTSRAGVTRKSFCFRKGSWGTYFGSLGSRRGASLAQSILGSCSIRYTIVLQGALLGRFLVLALGLQ